MEPLSELDVSNALQPLTVEETRNLFFHLTVSLNDLEDIIDQYNGERRKQHFVKKWLDMNPKARWNDVVFGLRKIKKNRLASEIESDHILSASYTATPHSPCCPIMEASIDSSKEDLCSILASFKQSIMGMLKSNLEKIIQQRHHDVSMVSDINKVPQ